MKLYPNLLTIFITFQLLYIWFKNEPYFSWWWLLFWAVVYIITQGIVDSYEKHLKRKERLLK